MSSLNLLTKSCSNDALQSELLLLMSTPKWHRRRRRKSSNCQSPIDTKYKSLNRSKILRHSSYILVHLFTLIIIMFQFSYASTTTALSVNSQNITKSIIYSYHQDNTSVLRLHKRQTDLQSFPLLSSSSSISSTTIGRTSSLTSTTTLLLQRFLTEPDNLTVKIGESVLLPCRISNKAGTVQWTRDGFGLGTDPRLEGFPTYTMIQNDLTGDYSLKISSVTLEDDATFQCQVGALDRVPGIRSQSAKLTVQVTPDSPVIVHGDFVNAPIAVQDKQVLSTTAGTKIELICEAHGGRPAAKLLWINGRGRPVTRGLTSTITEMKDGKRFNSALKWTFEPTKSDHNKKVSCRSSHSTLANYSAASILLQVKYAPEVKLDFSRITTGAQKNGATLSAGNNLHGRVGDTFRYKCLADGNPGNEALEYRWYKGDELIYGDHREELILQDVDKSMNGVVIKCKVSNSVGTGKASHTLNIAYGPSFLSTMEYVYGVTSGESARISCNVDANPTPEITWIKVGSSSVMATGPKLTIRNVNQEHVGEYLCRASVKGFTEISAIIYLRINGPPKIRKNKKMNNYAVLGESGHIDCLVESVPPPIAITWIHNGQVFTSSSANNIPTNFNIHEENLAEEAVALKTSFDVKATIQTDYGHYNCVVVNRYGSDWHVVTLVEQTSFTTIVTFTLISISVLVFIVLTTIIFLLSLKHRRLIKDQQIKEKQLQQKQQHSDAKSHYLSGHDDLDHHNIYSTTASTRTNSSSDKATPGETGTIITRSGSTGSPRSSTSSFPPFLDNSSNSPGPNNNNSSNNGSYVLNSGTLSSHNHHHNHHQQSQHHLVHPSQMTTVSPPPLPLHHHHHHLSTTFPEPPSPSRQSSFFNSFEINHPMNTYHHHGSTILESPFETVQNGHNPYSTLQRHSQLSTGPASYSFVPMYQYQANNQSPQSVPQFPSSSEPVYKASLYQVTPTTNNVSGGGGSSNGSVTGSIIKSHVGTLPTPPPSLAKELDNCISKNSIATHV